MSTDSDGFRSKFGERLKLARKNVGLNQTDFANWIGSTRDTVSRYERGELSPPADVLSKMISALGPNMTADWLLLGRGEDLEGPQPIRLKDFGSLVGFTFNGPGIANVSMGANEVRKILKACIENEQFQSTPNHSVITKLKELVDHFYEADIELMAEVLIAIHAARLRPLWPHFEDEQRIIREKRGKSVSGDNSQATSRDIVDD